MAHSKNAYMTQIVAIVICVAMLMGMFPFGVVTAAYDDGPVAEVSGVPYESLEDALDAVPAGTDRTLLEEVTVKLLRDTEGGFNFGKSDGSETKNISIDLNGNTLTLASSVGSSGTASNGIRVLAYSKLKISGGLIVCSDKVEDNIKIGIANYGELTLEDVTLKAGELTVYSINNRGTLNLKGETVIENGTSDNFEFAITNDPYNLYYTETVNATLNCNSEDVKVGSVQIERYERNSSNDGVPVLNISAGNFGKIVEDGNNAIEPQYNITGGTVYVSSGAELATVIGMIKAGEEKICPAEAVTIKLACDIEQGFDIGTSNGSAPKNITIDLCGNKLILNGAVGSSGTASNGIRVLAYSKLKLVNGSVVCADDENIKIGIANYSDLVLDNVKVISGNETVYTVNNRGTLTLLGETVIENGKIAQNDYQPSGYVAVTNDPYSLYYTKNASIICSSDKVEIGNIQLERYGNEGSIVLDIKAGTFGEITEPRDGNVTVEGNIRGGVFANDVYAYCAEGCTSVEKTENGYEVNYTGYKQDFFFNVLSPDSVKWNELENNIFNNFASSAQTNNKVTYSISDNPMVADIDPDTGDLYLKQAGTVTVTAYIEGDDIYAPAEATYTLTVEKADQSFAFKDGELVDGKYVVNKLYGIESYKNKIIDTVVENASDGKGYGSGNLKYEIVENNISASVDRSGNIFFFDNKMGKVTVKVTREADSCYNSFSAEYTVVLEFESIPEVAFELVGEKGENDWFRSDVEIKAPEGYLISTSNSLRNKNWTESVVYTAEGTGNVTVYLKNIETNGVTTNITVNVKKDCSPANNIDISYDIDERLWIKLGNLFGFKDDTVCATVTAMDDLSGISKVEYSLDEETYYEAEFNGADYVFDIDPEFRNSVSLKVTNGSGLVSEYKDGRVIVVDTVMPGFYGEYEYNNGKYIDDGEIIRVQNGVNVVLKLNAANFDLSEKPVVKVDGKEISLEWDTNGTLNISDVISLEEYGDRTIEATFKDRLGRQCVYLQKFCVDGVAEKPEIILSDSFKAEEDGRKYFDTDQKVSVVIREHNFSAENVYVEIESDDPAFDSPKITEEYKSESVWTNTGADEWTAVIDFEGDANYTVKVYYEDLLANKAESDVEKLTVDKTAPECEDIIISSSKELSVWDHIAELLTFGAYRSDVTVTITAKDTVSGIESIQWNYIREKDVSETNVEKIENRVISAETESNAENYYATFEEHGDTVKVSFKLTAEEAVQYRGQITAKVTNKTLLTSDDKTDRKVIIVDSVSPDVSVSYSEAVQSVDGTTYYDGDVTVTVTVNEANFYSEDINSDGTVDAIEEVTQLLKNCHITVDRDGTATKAGIDNWEQNGDVWTGSFVLSEEGDYTVSMDFSDRSGNHMVYNGEEVGEYKSGKIVIDRTAPVIGVLFDKEAFYENGTYYYNGSQTVKVVVSEDNFSAVDVTATVSFKNTMADSEYTDISSEYNEILKKAESWELENGKYVANINFPADRHYTFDIDCIDLVNKVPEKNYDEVAFVVDATGPKTEDIIIEYSEPVSVWTTMAEILSFGAYKSDVTVTVTAKDICSGINSIRWTYEKEKNASSSNVAKIEKVISKETVANAENYYATFEENGDTIKATFKLTAEEAAQYRGSISAATINKSQICSETKTDSGNIIVVDNITPDISVKYSNAKQTVNGVAYYDGKITVTVTVKEANFYAEDINAEEAISHLVENCHITVERDGKKVSKSPTDWTQSGDVWTGTFTLAEDGDYIIYMDFADRSGNPMVYNGNAVDSYKSGKLVIDLKDPTVNVAYGNKDVIRTISGNDYFNKNQRAVITIVEDNFRASDVNVAVSAKDFVGNNIAVRNYAEYLSKESSWTHNGNIHTAEIEYNVDANYTFDITYTDMAKRTAADYKAYSFTVDKTVPVGLQVEYSTNLLEKIIEDITFGYYNAQMTVTIKASDDVAGVHSFKYSYERSEEVSTVNAELIDKALKGAEITYVGKVAVASFKVPKLVLGEDNQFNGKVEFVAYDCADNESKSFKDESTVIVVDNIKPTATVSFDKPVKTDGEVSYYDKSVNGTIVINEANFYSQDVIVTVTRDGVPCNVNVTWTDDSYDIHTGRFTLSDNGDYYVSVDYTDRSTNMMVPYRSARITVDKTVPVISMSGIENNTAIKADKIGLTVIAEDTNLDMSTFKPSLTAVVRDEDGGYSLKAIALGEMKVVEAGKKYEFVLENLVEDAVYTLTCSVSDMSGNTHSIMTLEDGKSYETVKFSVNRNGSTFSVDKDTAELLEKYYVYSVENDVVIEEINVDPVENYVVKVNGKLLEEDKGYKTVLTGGTDKWSKRTYIIDKAYFDNEGEYSVVVESVDKSDTIAFSDVKNLKVAFVVDRTAPVLTISGLEEGGRYQTDRQSVTVIPTDDGGKLGSFKAILLDAEGKELSVCIELSGDDLIKHLEANDGKIVFDVPEGYENQVRIICNDSSVNTDNQSNSFDQVFGKVTVSQSDWVIFYANKPAFYGTIIGVIVAIAALVLLTVIVFKKKSRK